MIEWVNNQLEIMWNKFNLMSYIHICLEWLRKTMQNSVRIGCVMAEFQIDISQVQANLPG